MLRTLSEYPGDVLVPKGEYRKLLKSQAMLDSLVMNGIITEAKVHSPKGYEIALATAEEKFKEIDNELGFRK